MSDQATPSNVPLVLLIRDGWGENPNREHDEFNAILQANTPRGDALLRDYPWAPIHTSGEDVGLPEGTMGNSEVGHQNIGAGRIVDQDSVRITRAIRDESFFENDVLADAVDAAAKADGTVHVLGIASDAGVHGLLDHLYATVDLCRRRGHERVQVHLFTDGRDTGPFTGRDYVAQVTKRLGGIGVGRIATVVGRYWAMDRDQRWDRTERAFAALTGRGSDEERLRIRTASGADEALARHYDDPPEGESMAGDEFVPPTIIGSDEAARDAGRITDGDVVIFTNYRGDRPRQIVRALAMDTFRDEVPPSPESGERGFDRRGGRPDVRVVTMTRYDETLGDLVEIGFPPRPPMEDIAGAYLSRLGLTQFRCAETEKYAHVTFFFNDYREEPFEGEHRRIIQSPRVATYDRQPEMSAGAVRDAVLERIRADDGEAVIVVNFANGDMVGHTGRLDAAIRAVETVDSCVGAIVEAALERGGSLIVTADHGNAEQMHDPDTGSPHTAHTLYDVPLTVVGEPFRDRRLRGPGTGRLADVLPTALAMMGLDAPDAMTGESLLESDGEAT